jgi:phosphoribosylanthranilate isomerase
MRVKICGLTREADVESAISAGADAVGFINVPGGPRYLEARRIVELTQKIPPFVTPVAVVDLTDPLNERGLEDLRLLCSRGIRCIQFHGHEPAWEISRLKGMLGFSAIKAIRLRQERDMASLEGYSGVVEALLVEGAPGQGVACDWDLATRAVRSQILPVILAGGLNPANVAAAVETVGPYAVDVSSGIESSPGIKDPAAVAAFIEASRRGAGRAPRGA